MTAPRIAYISFDTVPAPKGASTHIEAFTRALSAHFGDVHLVTVGATAAPVTRGLHTELPALGPSLIDRVLCFRSFLSRWLLDRQFEKIHFRSIFEGIPVLKLGAKLIFEVNGLPSIELKYRYPGMEDDRELMRKIVAQENACLQAANLIVTPSNVTAGYLNAARHVPTAKIRVIPNGVDPGVFQDRVEDPATLRLIYFGTLSPWQGVELGIRALAQIRQVRPATLTIIGSGSGRELDALSALAAKLGIASAVRILPAMPQSELATHLSNSDIVLAPLTLNDRNVLQGCCPLKVLEGMAAGAAVIASDLPVVRELGCDGVHFLLVKPGSVDQIAQAALTPQDALLEIGKQARAHVLENYTWERAGNSLASAYREL